MVQVGERSLFELAPPKSMVVCVSPQSPWRGRVGQVLSISPDGVTVVVGLVTTMNHSLTVLLLWLRRGPELRAVTDRAPSTAEANELSHVRTSISLSLPTRD